MRPYVVVTRRGWLAYKSVWAYVFDREPMLRARTWEAMRLALIELRAKESAGAWQERPRG